MLPFLLSKKIKILFKNKNMTTPFDSNSKTENNIPQENFSIRTMQDDLLKLQTTGKIEPMPIEGGMPQVPVKENIISQTQPSPNNATYNPFATMPTDSTIQSAPINIIAKETQKTTNEATTILPKIIWTLIIIFILSITALGGYYYWTTKKVAPPVEVVSAPDPVPAPIVTEEVRVEEATETREEIPPVMNVTPPVDKYSTTKPNYLVLDTNNIGTETIRETIAKVADELKNSPSQSLYEFVPVDANNAPIAFPIFTIAAKLNLSSKVLSDLGTNFSLLLYNDNGEVRLALASTVSKSETLAADMAIQEKTFLQDADFLFLRMIPDKTTAQFGSSTYKDVAVRYINASQQKNLSIDYAITNSQLLIGTSKNTLRVVIDKISTPKTIR
jgi:hypothetical protein